jgi:hypothetical protein
LRCCSAGCRFGRKLFDFETACFRERTTGVDVWTDSVTVVNEVKDHCAVRNTSLSGVGGWLSILCGLLLIWGPINVGLFASSMLDGLSIRGLPLAVVIAVRLVVTALGIAAGLSLLHARPGAVLIAKVALVVSAAADLWLLTSPYVPSNRPPGEAPWLVAISLAYHGAWLAYLSRSVRVRNTFS